MCPYWCLSPISHSQSIRKLTLNNPFYRDKDLSTLILDLIETHNDVSEIDIGSALLIKKGYHQQHKDFPYTFIPER